MTGFEIARVILALEFDESGISPLAGESNGFFESLCGVEWVNVSVDDVDNPTILGAVSGTAS